MTTVPSTTLWLLQYDLVDDYVERRPPLRPEHLADAQAAHEAGDLVLAGALDPPDGALLVFRSQAAAESFAAGDPYVREGLVKTWHVRAWTVVIGT